MRLSASSRLCLSPSSNTARSGALQTSHEARGHRLLGGLWQPAGVRVSWCPQQSCTGSAPSKRTESPSPAPVPFPSSSSSPGCSCKPPNQSSRPLIGFYNSARGGKNPSHAQMERPSQRSLSSTRPSVIFYTRTEAMIVPQLFFINLIELGQKGQRPGETLPGLFPAASS